jgi:hypothetical protein
MSEVNHTCEAQVLRRQAGGEAGASRDYDVALRMSLASSYSTNMSPMLRMTFYGGNTEDYVP